MLILDDQIAKLSSLQNKIDYLKECLNKDALLKELSNLKAEQTEPNFFADLARVKLNGKMQKEVELKLSNLSSLEKQHADIDFLIEYCKLEDDVKIVDDINQKLNILQQAIEESTISTLLNGQYDDYNAIMSLHAGAGGTEAQDWVSMLFRMYSRYCERNGYKVTVIDMLPGDDAGIKSVTFGVEGFKAYGYLKAEKGVHRLVRISPFDANKRRHTSFASLDVLPEIEDNNDIELSAQDVRIDTYRSSGAGGQHVNKTDSAIRLTHLSTGIVVTCQNERSQLQNKEMAFKILKSKLLALKQEEREKDLGTIQGELKKIEWGSQIRSYVFCPYTMVKDHRTNFETANVEGVMDGDIKPFILDYLKKSKS